MGPALPGGTGLKHLGLFAAAALLAGCGDDGMVTPDGGGFCPMLFDRLADPGDPIDETYAGFAQPFFEGYCTRCHHSSLPEGEMRGFAPTDVNLDDPVSIRTNAPRIRDATGVFNYMPIDEPLPTCEERRSLVTWIDADMPGL